MRTNVVGRGLMPKPTVDADVLKISPEKAREHCTAPSVGKSISIAKEKIRAQMKNISAPNGLITLLYPRIQGRSLICSQMEFSRRQRARG